MDYEYQLINGNYVLYGDGEPIGAPLPEVAMAFTKANPEDPTGMATLHKHGSEATVTSWAKKTREQFCAAGYFGMADDIVVISGKFPLEELNKCLAISGYIGRLWQSLTTEGRSHCQTPREDTDSKITGN